MKGSRARVTRSSAFEPGPGASQQPGCAKLEALAASMEWSGEGGVAADFGQSSETASGLGAFYAYQMAVRSIERS